jgi:hypothetical protein
MMGSIQRVWGDQKEGRIVIVIHRTVHHSISRRDVNTPSEHTANTSKSGWPWMISIPRVRHSQPYLSLYGHMCLYRTEIEIARAAQSMGAATPCELQGKTPLVTTIRWVMSWRLLGPSKLEQQTLALMATGLGII